jgi:glycosyltransferase involved in cell wall biosynthesis
MVPPAPQPGRPLDRSNVAAVIPAYHEEAHVRGVAERTRVQLDHVLVVDDGSTDATGAILAAFASKHPNARALRAEGIGLAAALSLAARHARGELFARQDDDDRSRPARLMKQVQHLLAHAEISVLGTGASIIDEGGRTLSPYPLPMTAEAIRNTLRRGVPFVHGSVMMRRAAYEKAGGYRACFRASQDFDLWLRMAPDAGFANLDEPLYEWRLHAAGVFSRAREAQLFYSSVARAFAEERRDGGVDSTALLAQDPDPDRFLAAYPRAGRLAFLLGETYAREGRAAESRRFFAHALRDPRSRGSALPYWLLTLALPFTPRGRRAATRARAATAANDRATAGGSAADHGEAK